MSLLASAPREFWWAVSLCMLMLTGSISYKFVQSAESNLAVAGLKLQLLEASADAATAYEALSAPGRATSPHGVERPANGREPAPTAGESPSDDASMPAPLPVPAVTAPAPPPEAAQKAARWRQAQQQVQQQMQQGPGGW